MYFGYSKKKLQLKRQHEKEKPMMIAAGMSDKSIANIFNFDKRQLHRDFVYYKHLSFYIRPEHKIYILSNEDDDACTCENPFIRYALSVLKESQKIVVWLRVVDGFTLKEIADILMISYASVRQRYSRAIKKMKKNFEKCHIFES